MKKLYLLRNPLLFQGEKRIKKNKNYFEGWYFKNNSNDNNISFIPGISVSDKDVKAFIQVITNNSSYYIDYNIDDFVFNHNPFYIKIGNNYFSENNLHIDINDSNNNLIIYGDLIYSNNKNIKVNLFNPNIMGPFSYIPFMECNHALISMKNTINGKIMINNEKMEFNDGIGYIEKDWGYSFPKTYIWGQGNNFQKSNASFMISIADIPFKIFHFKGLICSLIIDNQEFRFATYNNTKILKYDIYNNLLNIVLKKGSYCLEIKLKDNNSFKLSAPSKGKMCKNILESVNSKIMVTLKKHNKIIFQDISKNCGLEIVQ